MTHVNLDTQPEVVRQFVLGLSDSPDGVVLESAGRPVACVVPLKKSTEVASALEGEWTEEKNRRRCELLDRKYDHGLSPSEEAELALLQDAMHRTIDKVAPLPLDLARSLHQELLEKAAQARDATQT
jgi:antitoxin (DNA-binding transcriptional repressor) of toxin-antitoxin stability system